MPWIEKVPAIMQSWYLGSEAGPATANVISGDVNPSGKLPFSIPYNLEDNGAHHFGPTSYPGIDDNQVYQEDILVGYRWHDTKKIPARFPFGYGLSYTTFNIGKVITDKKEYAKDETINISLTVSNTGKVAGSEAIQLYTSQQNPSLTRPAKELKAFKKIFLGAGESKSINLEIPVKDLAYFDDKKHDWVIENDKFIIHCGNSSTKITSSIDILIK